MIEKKKRKRQDGVSVANWSFYLIDLLFILIFLDFKLHNTNTTHNSFEIIHKSIKHKLHNYKFENIPMYKAIKVKSD